MISYTEIEKIKEGSFWRDPVKRAHRKIVVFTKMNGKLRFEILKRVKFVRSIKVFIVLTV